MLKLWLDLGNTRLKYWITNEQYQVIQQDAQLHLHSPMDLLLGLIQYFKSLSIQMIGISSVLDNPTNQRIKQVLQMLNVPIYFAQVQDNYAGLKIGYDHPQQLGIDRWLQLLAMTKHIHQYCIVGCGTALTLDILDKTHHLGGYILPSLYLQRDALLQGTKGIQIHTKQFNQCTLGHNTQDAVHHGILLGLIGAIHQVLIKYPHYQLIFTGGDAALFASFFKQSHTVQVLPDLLLMGLQHYVDAMANPMKTY